MSETAENLRPLDQRSASVETPIKLFVIADQDIYVDGLVRVISDHPGHSVVACMSPGRNCFEHFCSAPADILLVEQSVIEQRLEHTPVEELFANFRETFPRLRIAVFGHNIADAYVRKMLRAGVHGFIDNHTPRELLVAAIQEIHSGGYWVGRKVLQQLIYSSVEMDQIVEQGIRDKINSVRDTLTRRESDVLQRVLEGMSTKQIAADLKLSEQSIKLYLGRLFRKFEVTNRSQLILMAFQRVCPANNMIQLFRKVMDKHRITKGQSPLIEDPLADIH